MSANTTHATTPRFTLPTAFTEAAKHVADMGLDGPDWMFDKRDSPAQQAYALADHEGSLAFAIAAHNVEPAMAVYRCRDLLMMRLGIGDGASNDIQHQLTRGWVIGLFGALEQAVEIMAMQHEALAKQASELRDALNNGELMVDVDLSSPDGMAALGCFVGVAGEANE